MDNKIVYEKQDLTYLSWSRIRNSSGTAGSFLKAYSELGGKKRYYKLSNYDAMRGVIGHECVNELIADRLLTILGIDHLTYRLIHADIIVNEKPEEVYLCASEDFKQEGEDKTALGVYYEAEHLPGEKPLNFCIRQGWEHLIWEMLIIDYLILDRDRHGANMEVLRNKRRKTVRMAPLFDHGLSLLFQCMTERDAREFDVMEDRPIQSFVGSRSAWQNLTLIPKESMPILHPLEESHRAVLLDGLDEILPSYLRDKIWEMIWKRWCRFEDFCHSR